MEVNELDSIKSSMLEGEPTPKSNGKLTISDIQQLRQETLGHDTAEKQRIGESIVGYNTRPDKYNFQMKTYADNAELRANRFGALKSFGTGLGKLITNTAADLAGGAASIVAGIPSAIASGDANQIFDNGISAAITNAQNWVNEEVLPMYNSVKDQDKNILHRALTDMEFWTNDVLGEGVPFILSAWLTAYAGVGALRPLTKARYLSKIKAAQGLGAEATAGIAKSLQESEQLTAAFLSRTTEGLVEAKDTRDQVYNKLTAKGLSPEEASQEAGKAAMTTFGLNYLLMPVEYIQAGTWFKNFSKSRDQLLQATKQGFQIPKRYVVNKAAKDIGINAITEGPIEENFQKAVQDYTYEQFTGNHRDEVHSWERELTDGVSDLFSRMGENFTTKEGWDAIGTGSILGGLFGGAATALSANSKGEKQRLADVKGNLDLFNSDKEKVNDRVKSIIENLKGFEQLDALSKVQEAKGKENFWNIFESLKFGEYAFANFEAGLGGRLHDQIDEISNLSEKDFLSGYKDKNKVNELKQKATRYEDLYNMISERFQIADDKDGRRVKQSLFREAILQDELQNEIGKLTPQVDSLREQVKPLNEYSRIIRDKNTLVRENRGIQATIDDIRSSSDESWKKTFGNKLAKKLERDIKHNSRLIAQLEKAKIEFKEENEITPKIKQSKITKDQLKLAEKNLLDLTNSLNTSRHRYDLLADPNTQKGMSFLLSQAEEANSKTLDNLKSAENKTKTDTKAAEVSQEVNKTPEKVLSNIAQIDDQVTATLKSNGEEVRGRVFEVNPDGTVKNIKSNNVIHPISTLETMIVTKKVAEETPIDEGNDALFASLVDSIDSGSGQTFDPFAEKPKDTNGIINFLDGLKIDTNGTANDVVRVIGATIWNGSIEAIKLGIQAGLSFADAIQKGVDYVVKHYRGTGFDKTEYINTIRSGGRKGHVSEPLEGAINNPKEEFDDEDYLFEQRKKRTEEHALGGKDIEYTTSNGIFYDLYSNGKLIRSEQEDYYNYVNDPNVKLEGVEGKLTLIDNSGNPNSMHIRFTLPNGLYTSINTVEWVRNNVANITEEQIKKFADWRKNLVELLQAKREANLVIRTKGPGALLRNEKIGGKRARRKLSTLFNKNTTPIGVTIQSKQGEQHSTALYDWKGAPTDPVVEKFGFGKSGRVYVGIPAANNILTPVPVWSRNLSEAEARLVIAAVRKRFEGKNYELIPGSTWTYNDLIRFYVYPSSTAKAFDVFISDTDQIIRVGSTRYGSADILSFPQDLIVGLMQKTHQVQIKRIRNNEEVPIFTLLNGQIVTESTVRYRDYLFDNILETDIQPIETDGKKFFFAQPVITYDENSPFSKTKAVIEQAPVKVPDIFSEDDIFSLPAPKILIGFGDPHSPEAEIHSFNEKELLRVMKILPQVPISVVKDLISIHVKYGYSVLAVGKFQQGLITVFENAPSGTVYHEAFHAVFRMMLTDSERDKVFAEGAKLYSTPLADKYTIEEKLANDFEQYMLYDGDDTILKGDTGVQGIADLFRRLWNMIKTFVLQLSGKVTVDDIFKRIRTGFYKNFPADPTRFKSIAPKTYNLSPREDVAVMNYMTRMFFAGIFKSDRFDYDDIESIGLKNKDVVEVYNGIKDNLAKIAESAEGDLKAKYQHIITKFDELIKSHQVWMEKYKIQLPDIEDSVEDEHLKLKDSFSYREPTEFSAKDNAGYMVKLFISALPKMEREGDKLIYKKNELGLPEVVDYSTTWNFLLEKLNGLTDIADVATRLSPYFDVKPELEVIVNLLSKPGTLTQEIFKGQFLQSFSKFHTNPVTTLFEWEGKGEERRLKVRNITTDQDNLRENIRRSWLSNFLASDLVEIDPHTRKDDYVTKNVLIEEIASEQLVKINKAKGDVKTIKSSLERFGITFTDGAVESWVKQTENGIDRFTRSAKYIISKLADFNLADKIELFTGHEEVGNLNLLAEIEAQFNPTIFEAVHLNPENKPSYHFIQHNLLSLIVNDVNKGDTEYITKVLNSYYGANSVWARAMKTGVKPKIRLLEGARLEGNKGKLTTRLSPGMWISLRINSLLQAKPAFAILRPAEKKSEYALEGFELIKSGIVRNNEGKGLTAIDINSTELVNQFYGYFEDEYKRAMYAYLKDRKKSKADIAPSLLTYLGLNSEDDISTSSLTPFDERGKKLTFFGPIISQTNTTLLHKLENFHTPTNEEVEEVRLAIKKYLVAQVNRTFDYLNDQGVIQVVDESNVHKTSRTDSYKQIKLDGNSLNISNTTTIGKEALAMYAGDVFAAVADFSVNEIISAFEYIKITMGDPSFYKDFFKRTPLVVGTGKNSRVDRQIANYIIPEYGKLRNKYSLTKSDEEVINGDLKIAVVKSPHKRSSQIDEFKTQLKSLRLKDTEIDTLLKGYEDYDESDAFSWITPQAAREFLLRIGDWTPSLESIYNDIVSEKKVSYKRLKNFLTAMKLMGAGPINTGDNHVVPIAYLKTATLPLIPRAIKGRELETQLERMYQSGTDMVIVDSGSKGVSHNIQEFYNHLGSAETALFDNATFNFKYVKLQIDVQQKAKTKVVFGTQLRKLVFSNIFEYDSNNKLIEREYTVAGKKISTSNLWTNFNKSYERLTGLYRESILKELGIDFDMVSETYTIVDWENVVTKIKKEAQKRFYPTSVIDSIRLNVEKNGLDIPGDALVNRKMIENMLNALIYNTVVKQKMRGTTSVQIPVTGFEMKDSAKTKIDSTGELRFISYDIKGQKVLDAEIYLPHNFKAKFGYLNDLEISQVDPEVLQMIGFRIPTEGLRSIIKLRVKGFLPAEMGQVVVVPSELVAQAGSDFDIDKLNIMQPHYFYDEDSKRVRKVPSSLDSIEGIENSILDTVDGLLSHKDSFVPSLRTTSQMVDYMKSLATDLKNLKGDTSFKETDPLSIIEFDKKMDIAYKFIAGKDGVGVAARHNTHHVLTQIANLTLTDQVTELLGFKFNKNKEGKAILSGVKDVNNRHDILDITAGSVNGFVDIVKDPFIIDLFTDLNTAGIALTLVRLGAPIEWVVRFVNQPLIQRYIRNVEFARSEVGKISGLSVKGVLDKLRLEYYNKLDQNAKDLIDSNTWGLKAGIYKNLSNDQLDKFIAVGYTDGHIEDSEIQNNSLSVPSNEYYLGQLSLLNDFLVYSKLNERLRLLMDNSTADTKHVKTFNDADRFVRLREQEGISKDERLDTVFENYNDLFETPTGPTFIESFYRNGIKVEHTAFERIFPIRQSSRVQKAVRRIESYIGRSNSLKDYEIERISDSLMGYIMYSSLYKQEIKDFVLDQYNSPEQRLLVSSRMRYNLSTGRLKAFVKKGHYYKVGDKLNLNGIYSVKITKVNEMTPKELMNKYPSEAQMLGARFYKPANKKIYVYEVAKVKNDLVTYSGIRHLHEYKTSKSDTPFIKELQENLLFKNLRINFSAKANGVNTIRFRVRPTDNVVHEDLVQSWRNLFQSGDPAIREIAEKLARYAIYQSGMKQSNISFWKYIPPEEFSRIVNASLESFNEHLDNPAILSKVFKNLWRNDVYVPRLHRPESQTREILNDKGDTIGYVLRRESGANSRFFTNDAPPPFLKLTDNNTDTLIELVGFSGERQKGDAIYQVTSKLGDGTALTEFHEGESIYEDNNYYIDGIEALYQRVSSSAVHWTASAPLSPPSIVEESETTSTQDFAADNQNSTEQSDPNEDDDDLGSDFVNSFGFQLTPQDERKNLPELDSLLRSKLSEIGVSIESVNRIVTKAGSPIAMAKILDRTIQIAKGQADITTLPEEAAHMFVAMLDPNSPLMAKMMREISDYSLFKDVKSEYYSAYNGDEKMIRIEAIGKLIGNIIVNDFTGETSVNIERAKGWWNRLWEVLKRMLSKISLGLISEYVSNSPTVFQEFASNIVNKKTNRTLAESIINNNFDTIVMQLIQNNYLKKECI